MRNFEINVDEYINLSKEAWWNISSEYNIKEREISLREKISNEKSINKFIDEIFEDLKECPLNKSEQEVWKDALINKIINFCKKARFIENKVEENFILSLMKISKEFIKDARKFDSALELESIGQAIRNLWIMNMIQWILGMNIAYSKAMFAYSMLYPYSDNLVDSIEITSNEKSKINEKFKKKIEGQSIQPVNKREKQLFELIDMIEDEINRSKNKKVYESLLAIHKGQDKSIMQQCNIYSPYERDILSISIEKGGTSVLADGYLVCGDINKEKEVFLFLYGVLLQFCDDLQDVEEDTNNKSSTIFSQTMIGWKLDEITNKLFNFLDTILETNKGLLGDEHIKKFLDKNIRILIIEAISKNVKYYSNEYISNITRVSICRLNYGEKLYKKINKKYKNFKTNSGLGIEKVLMILSE